MAASRFEPLNALLVLLGIGAAAALGLLAGANPLLAIAGAVGIVYVAVVLESVLAGVVMLAFASFVSALGNLQEVSAIKVVGALLVLSWLALVLTRERDELHSARPVFAYTLVAFVLWVGISSVWATSDAEVWAGLRGYSLNLLLFPVFFTAIRSTGALRLVVLSIFCGALVAGLAGLLSPPDPSGASYLDPSRPGGTLGDANELAAAGVVGTALGFGLAAVPQAAGQRVLFAGGGALCLLSVLVSLSRGGIVALMVALLAAMVIAGRWRGPALAVVAALLVSGLTYFTVVASIAERDRVTNVENSTGRSDLWTVAARMVADHPVQGVGTGNFPVQSRAYLLRPGVIEEDDFVLLTPKVTHNTYLQVAAELGFVGLLLFLGIILSSLWSMVRAAQVFASRHDVTGELMARALAIGTIGFLSAGVFVSANYSKILWLLLAVGPAALAVAHGRRERAAA